MAESNWRHAPSVPAAAPPQRRRSLVCLTAVTLGVAAAGGFASAQEEPPPTAAVKGEVQGGEFLLNPVWNEARDPNNHRYTFRTPSVTVSQKAKTLTAFLPKEVPVVALGEGAKASEIAIEVQVSGGRTTPVTIVVPPGQSLQFVNRDPFPHALYTSDTDKGGLPAQPMTKGASRTWTPPGPGAYELRDELFPSVRSWVVVDARAVASGYPDLSGSFQIDGLPEGTYALQAYFNGAPSGSPVTIDVRPFPALQTLGAPIVVATKEGGD